ncbi:FAD-binding protein [uncultured Tolumonas sp.]|uniref:UDP-N-acetylmuramate dehydrogenase n=1 Tax=uncultured Tolumonas sp. TaxID=263765 RepID=UPI00293153A6|nr:FAD-binding protein [uncultured Tolumonas sp.]
MQLVEDFLLTNGLVYKKEISLSNITYCKTGGLCQLMILPSNSEQFGSVYGFLKSNGIKFSIIGETSNMLFLDDVTYGVIISTKLLDNISICNDKVKVDAGVNLGQFLRLMYSKKIAGFEGLEGIPGSVGGAAFMNAGAYGYEISDKIYSVECLNEHGDIITLNKDACSFTQRHSIFRESKKYIILSVMFDMDVSSDPNYYRKIEQYHISRHSYQEFVLPNIGSVFTAKKCVYDEFCKVDWKYKIIYKILIKIFYNKMARFFNRKSPNRSILNDFTVKYFKLDKVKNVFSIKHINMIANQNLNSWDILEYMYSMKQILENRVTLENDIVVDSIVKWDCDNNDVQSYKRKISSVIGSWK